MKKKIIALIGSSVLLLGMFPVLVIVDPVGFRDVSLPLYRLVMLVFIMEEVTELTAEVPEEPERRTARLYEQVVNEQETCDPETAEIIKVITAESHETDPDVTLDGEDLTVRFNFADGQDTLGPQDIVGIAVYSDSVNYPTTLIACKSGEHILFREYPFIRLSDKVEG